MSGTIFIESLIPQFIKTFYFIFKILIKIYMHIFMYKSILLIVKCLILFEIIVS